MADLWVDNRHPEYARDVWRRTFSRDQYTGRALEVSLAEAASMGDDTGEADLRGYSDFISEVPDGRSRLGVFTLDGAKVGNRNGGFGTYLIRRSQGESASAFRERARITRFPAAYAALTDAYVGGIAAVEGAGKWKLQEGGPLGEHDDPDGDSMMYRMWRDIDGTGRNWLGALNTAKKNLIVDDLYCSFTYMPTDGTYPLTEWIDPDRIVDWDMEDGRPVWLLIQESVWERPDKHEKGTLVDYYKEFDLDGWTQYRVNEIDDEIRSLEVVESQEWERPFYTDDTMTKRRLPFTWVRLSEMLGRYAGYQMALDHNALYNILSDARWNFRVINHPRLVINAENDQFDKITSGIAQGHNVIQAEDAKYIAPPSENGEAAYRTYSSEMQQFFVTNHQRMNTPNIERSATEILYNQAEGRTAFLSLFASAIDEIDNDWRFLSTQIVAPTNPLVWHSSTVERSRDFKPVDIDHLAQQHVNNFVAASGVLPADIAMKMAKEGISKDVMEMLEQSGQDEIIEEDL